MTSTEFLLLLLGGLMIVSAGYVQYKTKSAWAVVGVVITFTIAAYMLGLLA